MAKLPEMCPVESTARIVGGRWKAAVLEQLFQGTKRFSELKRGISGITQRTLAQQLRPAVHGNHRAYGVSRQAAACGIRDYASRKIPAAVARRNVPLGQVALGCHGIKKAPGFRSAAIRPSCWTTATSV